MRIHCKTVMADVGPSESVIAIARADGRDEEVIVHQSLIAADSIDVGPILQRSNGRALVELPRESVRGTWRIWVNSKDLSGGEAAP